ncbi:DNA end-binding protein Ku [Saccharopolyspora erythraea NRRL 2338]|uniref:Non-homologous end joining protein Ku 2 n=3 Tax=Saccharopolyspora erythraea TaxID=1836 RepID=KU2_SACEN|nr:RecName: Full=Non-homologous end joining protein Ku 2 [Saccharopolyspora erythraea NRRL 2338]EQD82066.1 DNA repair protein [Saccharopolyspora erythraea D]PFG96687.1 DNA end-binding protein Ku [Saccharopolyspora erythraea NRRL 2338]QRK86947.1 Ku protein [Saccharopolyspora erythraea]CAM02981.1 DNA binding protein, Ku-like [Saccharopolyspora erythraea NRRL 2338]
MINSPPIGYLPGMRTMWRGAISFGLVNIGVRLYAATADHDYQFHQVHRQDHGRIHHKRVCEECGREIDYDDIVKGYETSDGELVVLDSQDLRKLPIRTDRAIDLLECVPAEQVDPTYFQKTYYLEPEKSARRPYVLLREALRRTDLLAVVKITMRQRETLATIRPAGDVLVLHTMLWPDEIRRPDFDFLTDDAGDTEVSKQEIDMATSLVENMTEDFDPTEFTDDYQRALAELIDAKTKGTKPPRKRPEPADEGEVVDLMGALERSVDQARTSRTSRRKTTASASRRRSSSNREKTGSRDKTRKRA